MGQGCYYTNNITRTRAFWIDINPYYKNEETGEDMFDDQAWSDVTGNLMYELESLGYSHQDDYKFYNGLYNLTLDGGHGHEIVIRLEPKGEEQYHTDDTRIFNLAMANHERCYARLGKELKKLGYHLRIASSGYTSMKY